MAAMARPDLHPQLTARRLTMPLPDAFARIREFGRVMALSRNDAVVSETHGEYGEVTGGTSAVVHTDTIDLRVDFAHFHHGFSVVMNANERVLESLQFFDSDGTAVHKVYLEDSSDRAAFDQMHAAASPEPPTLELCPPAPSPDKRGRNSVDAGELRAAWAALTNVHQFTGMLKRLNVTRLAAVTAVGEEFAQPAIAGAHRSLLQGARDRRIPLMVFVRSPGCTQIHSGPVERLSARGEYYNVLDPHFNLHIREPRLAQAWVVRKPVREGSVTSLEIYDAADEVCLQFFGVRDESGAEDSRWLELAQSLVDHR